MHSIRGKHRRGRHGLIRALPFLLALCSGWTIADEPAIPHVSAKARDSYAQSYRYASPHKAFAIAPGGSWSWRAEAADARTAGEQAIAACAEHTDQTCVLFDLNGETVFDSWRWPGLWAPYPSAAEAASRPVGSARGQRFPNLRFSDSQGREHRLSDFRGKLVLVHFWGSWCPPCMREFPGLQTLYRQLQTRLGDRISMILLQAREPFSQSMDWARKNRFDDLPLYDSGSQGSQHSHFNSADGTPIPDRQLAPLFPTSILLDRHGIVLFRHKGPVSDWREYLDFFEHASNPDDGPQQAPTSVR
jgi:thiol-disulfide isomerase/thioredoxin